VNQMSVSSNPTFRGNLFSHELGHNMGAPHVSDPGNSGNFLMEPSLNSASNGVSSQSTRSIQNYVNRRSCVSTENGNGGSGGGNNDDGGGNGGGDDDGGDNDGGGGDNDEDGNGGGDSEGDPFRLESALHQGLCVSVQGGRLTNGTPVNLERCNDSSSSQNWIWDQQTHLIQSAAGNKCLYPRGNARNGARMVVWDCNPSFSYAEWSYYNDQTLRPDFSTRKCLDVLNSNGRTLQMWQCNGTRDKRWVVRR